MQNNGELDRGLPLTKLGVGWHGLAVNPGGGNSDLRIIVGKGGDSETLLTRGIVWIGLELAGTKSNRLALNARIKAVAGELIQVDEVRSDGSYLSQNDLRVHFDLATHDHMDRVDILWPSGKTETLTNLAADRFYAVKEGEGVVPREKLRSNLPLRH